MKKISLALLLAAACSNTPAKVTLPSKAEASVVMVEIINLETGDGGWCTAWYAGKDTWVTAGHCIDPMYVMRVGSVWVDPSTMRADQSGDDVGYFEMATKAKPLKIAKEQPAPPTNETECVRVHYNGYPGTPSGEPFHGTFEGCYNGIGKDGDISLSMFVDGGASGAPLLNDKNEVIGVIVSSYRGRPYSYAEPFNGVEAKI